MEFILDDPRVPPWVREFPMSIRGTEARVDFLIPSCNLILEGDGRNWHTRRTDFENDRRRDNALAAAGYQVMRFTYSMLKTEPEECLEQVIAVANHRAA